LNNNLLYLSAPEDFFLVFLMSFAVFLKKCRASWHQCRLVKLKDLIIVFVGSEYLFEVPIDCQATRYSIFCFYILTNVLSYNDEDSFNQLLILSLEN
jgi:hypothetical protein